MGNTEFAVRRLPSNILTPSFANLPISTEASSSFYLKSSSFEKDECPQLRLFQFTSEPCWVYGQPKRDMQKLTSMQRSRLVPQTVPFGLLLRLLSIY